MRSPARWILLCALALALWIGMVALIARSIRGVHVDERGAARAAPK